MDSVKVTNTDPDRMLKLLQAAAATTEPIIVSAMDPIKKISVSPSADSSTTTMINGNEIFSGTEPDSQSKPPTDCPTLISSASIASMSSMDEIADSPKTTKLPEIIDAKFEYVDATKQAISTNAAIVSMKRMRYHTHQIGKSIVMGKLHDVNNQLQYFQDLQRDTKVRKLRNEEDASSRHNTTKELSDEKHAEEMALVDLEIFRRNVLRNASHMKHLANLFRDLESLQGDIIREMHSIDTSNQGISIPETGVKKFGGSNGKVQHGEFLSKFKKSMPTINLYPRFTPSNYATNYDATNARIRKVSINNYVQTTTSSSMPDETTDVST